MTVRSYALPTAIAVLALSLVAVAVLALRSQPAAALEFTVTRFDDPVPNGCLPNDCSLREAVIATNDPQIGPDLINLPAGTYMLTRDGGSPSAAVGDIDVDDDVAIIGEGASSTIIDASQLNDRIFDFGAFVSTGSIENLTLRNGSVVSGDGGIARSYGQVQFVDAVIENGEASTGKGGAIASLGSGSDTYFLTLIRTTVRDSEAAGDGGGIYSNSLLTVTGSTVSGNEATSGGGIQIVGDGLLNMTNSTVSGNTASGSAGGLNSLGSGDATLASVTVSDNHAGESGGGLGGNFTLRNTIVSGNSDTTGDPDCDGDIISEPANHIGIQGANCNVTGETTFNTTGNAMLGPLTWNGGPTDTHALLGGSPAINTGAATGCTSATGGALSTDQRGGMRHVGPKCDIGAYELGAVPPATPTLAPTAPPTPTRTPRITSTPTPEPTVAPGECPEPTPKPSPFHVATLLYACNMIGISASGIYVSVSNAANKDVVAVAAPGCGDSVSLTFNHPDFGPEYDSVTVDWGEPCIDPGETVVLKFGVNGPGGQGIVHRWNWVLPASKCPSASPTPTPTPDSKSFIYTMIAACNDTGMTASDLHLTFDFLDKVGSAPLVANPAGCGIPEFSQPQGHQLDIDWQTPCVDPGESAVFRLASDCGGCAVNVIDFYWTFAPSPTQVPTLQGDVTCNQTVDSVDALGVARAVAGFDEPPCIAQGDVDCDGDRDSVDALGILRHVAALPPLDQNEPCADIGTPT